MRGILYVRVSSDAQTKGAGLPDQEDAARAYCAARGIEVAHVVSDDFTGRVTDRPGVQRIRALAAEDPTLSVVVLTKVDRIARRAHLGLLLEEEFRRLGLAVVYTDQTFEQTPTGRFQRTAMGAVAELESDLIAERTGRGRLRKATEQRVAPSYSEPFGYHQIRKAESLVIPDYAGRSGELIPHPKNAAVLRDLFQRAAAGDSLRGLAAWLNATGSTTKRNHRWTASSVRRVLRQSCYWTGTHHYRKQASELSGELTSGGNPRLSLTDRPRADWLPIPCPVLIDKATFDAVQVTLLRNTSEKAGQRPDKFLLGGAVFCGTCRTRRGLPRRCGGETRRGKGNPPYYYTCRVCYAYARGPELESDALLYLRRVCAPGRLGAQLAAAAARARKPGPDPARLAAELEGARSEEAALMVAYASAQFSVEALTRNVSRLHARIADLQERLARAEEDARPREGPTAAHARGEEIAALIRRGLARAEEEPEALKPVLRRWLAVTIRKGARARFTLRVGSSGS